MTETLSPALVSVPVARRRTRGRVLLSGVAAVGLLAGGVSLSAASRYDPLAPGNVTVSAPDVVSVQHVGDNRDVYQLPFAPDADRVLTFTVANHGRFAVTLDRVVTDPEGNVFRLARANARVVSRGIEVGPPSALPYRLAPGQQVAFEVTYVLRGCSLSPGGGFSMSGLPVRWHAFGSSHTTVVRVPLVAVTVPGSLPARFQAPCPSQFSR